MTIKEMNEYTTELIQQGKGDYKLVDGYMGGDINKGSMMIVDKDKELIV